VHPGNDETDDDPKLIDVPELDGERPTTQTDWDRVSADYIAEARRETAKLRWERLADEMPLMVETDWERPQFDANRAALETVLNWEHQPKGLLLTGPTGRGKTRAILSMIRRQALGEGRDFRYWHASSWFSELQRQCKYGQDESRSWVEATAVRPLVVIDDLGQEAIGSAREDWAQSWWFRFLDVRLGKGLPLIVTTNLSASAIAGTSERSEIRADPLIRRLLDLCDVIKFV
jgi:DNA replication protein DnaC